MAPVCSAAGRVRLDSFLNRCKRLGFVDKDLAPVSELFSDADDTFFERIMINSERELQPFLPEKPDMSYHHRMYSQSIVNDNKKAVLPQGNRAMPQVFFSVEVRQRHSLL